MGIAIPTHPLYTMNFQGVSRGHGPCCVCGRDVTTARASFLLVDWANEEAVTREEAWDGALDVGKQPIGSDCLRRHPELRPYVVSEG